MLGWLHVSRPCARRSYSSTPNTTWRGLPRRVDQLGPTGHGGVTTALKQFWRPDTVQTSDAMAFSGRLIKLAV